MSYYCLKNKTIRLEFDDETGSRYSLKVSGAVTRDKIMKLVDLYELMNTNDTGSTVSTIYGKIETLLKDKFILKRFSSKDVLTAFEDEYKTGIKLSIISTYLRRLTDDNLIVRFKNGREWIYSFKPAKQKVPVPLPRRTKHNKPTIE